MASGKLKGTRDAFRKEGVFFVRPGEAVKAALFRESRGLWINKVIIRSVHTIP